MTLGTVNTIAKHKIEEMFHRDEIIATGNLMYNVLETIGANIILLGPVEICQYIILEIAKMF